MQGRSQLSSGQVCRPTNAKGRVLILAGLQFGIIPWAKGLEMFEIELQASPQGWLG
jgi:hypothetical protein